MSNLSINPPTSTTRDPRENCVLGLKDQPVLVCADTLPQIVQVHVSKLFGYV